MDNIRQWLYKQHNSYDDKYLIELFKDTYKEYYIASLEGKKISDEEINRRVEKTTSYAENISKDMVGHNLKQMIWNKVGLII